jgi:hypothetical protein
MRAGTWATLAVLATGLWPADAVMEESHTSIYGLVER